MDSRTLAVADADVLQVPLGLFPSKAESVDEVRHSNLPIPLSLSSNRRCYF